MSEELKTAIDAVKAASQILLEYRKTGDAGSIKNKTETDRTSDADIDSEQAIRKIISTKFPHHRIIGEEFGEKGDKSEYAWYLDPLCGSIGFIHGFIEFGVSVALMYKNELIIGTCALPALGEVYWAEKGKGAFMNGKRIHVSKIENIHDAVVTTDLSTEPNVRNKQIKLLDKISKGGVQLIYMFGSFPYALSYLANGKSEGHVELDVPPLHRLAATIIVLEAGGKLTQLDGSEASLLDNNDVVFSNGFFHKKLIEVINSQNL